MRGLITAPQPEAAEVGADILASGGNAVDAAVGAALVQTVVDPIMCGLAGFGVMHVYRPDAGVHEIINFHGRAPKAATPDMWAHLIRGEAEDGFGFLLEGAVNEIGYQSVTTPMTLAALDHALNAHGTLTLSDLLPAAVAYAREGFLVRPHVNAFLTEVPQTGRLPHREFATRYPGTRAIYAPDGDPVPVGHHLKNPDMARTLERIAANGASDFYKGGIASDIAADMAGNGGLLSGEDLAEVAPTVSEPLWGTYRGNDIATNPLPGGGTMILLMLNILENFDLAAMGHNSPEYIATVSEAMKIATVAKDNHMGDPRFVDVPDELITKDYAREVAEGIKSGEIAHVPRMKTGGRADSKDTTHLCTVDAHGSCVSLTHSIGAPSGVVTPGLGFMYNGCMAVFDPRPGRAGSLAPGKSRFTAMCPTIIFRGGAPWFVVGAPGGTYITMGVLQAILNAVDFGMNAQEAVSAPRFCTTSDTIDITNRILRRTEAALRDKSYPVRRSPLSHAFSRVHAARRTDAGWDGGADPGADGMALKV